MTDMNTIRSSSNIFGGAFFYAVLIIIKNRLLSHLGKKPEFIILKKNINYILVASFLHLTEQPKAFVKLGFGTSPLIKASNAFVK